MLVVTPHVVVVHQRQASYNSIQLLYNAVTQDVSVTFHISSFSTSSAPLPPFDFSLDPAPPLLSFIVLHLHNEAKA